MALYDPEPPSKRMSTFLSAFTSNGRTRLANPKSRLVMPFVLGKNDD
jgi:hypothetical protein